MGRDKPGKPRRERPEQPEPSPHDHSFGSDEDIPDPYGRQVDNRLLGEVVGAAFDGCKSCQDLLLTRLVEDSGTTARLVEMACGVTSELVGGLPPGMLDDAVPGPSSLPFRRLARAGLDGAHDAMWEVCAEMSVKERRAAVNTALDTLIGHLMLQR
jgi:hypothetical protein